MSDRLFARWKFVPAAAAWALLGCVALAAWGQTEGTASGDAAAPDCAALVRQLGDLAYARRCEAAERLKELGLRAEDALRGGLDHPDPEIARQCRWLLAELRVADFRRRVDAFAADKEGKREHALPYWDLYRKIVGQDRPARDFFLEMLKAEGPLLEVASQGPEATLKAIQARWVPMMRQRHGLGVERQLPARVVAAWLLVLADFNPLNRPAPGTPLELDPFGHTDLFSNLLEEADLKKGLLQGAGREPLRKILGYWVLRAANLDQAAERLSVALRYELKESLVLAAVILKSKEGMTFERASLAATAVALHGGKTHAAMLEPLFSSEESTQTSFVGNLHKTVQVRDIALAWLVELTGQSHAAYGMPEFKEAVKRLRAEPHTSNNCQPYGFYAESSREAAMAKWRDYAAAHPLPKAPTVEIPAELADRLKQAQADGSAIPTRLYVRAVLGGRVVPVAAPVPAGGALPAGAVAPAIAPADAPDANAPAPGPDGQPPLEPAEPETTVPQDEATPGEEVPTEAVPSEAVPTEAPPEGNAPAAQTVPAHPRPADEVRPQAVSGPLPAEQIDPFQEPEPSADDESAEDGPIANLHAEWADRDTVRKLKAAGELAAERRFGQAARLLDEVLEDPADKLFLRATKQRLAGSLHREAEQMLANLPAEGMKAYQTQCQVKARRLLAEAVAAGDAAQIVAVGERYFFTIAGAEAALLTAQVEMDRGEFARAALRLEKIRRQSPHAARLEPQLSLRAAACRFALGEGEDASRILGELEAAQPGAKPVIAGRAASALPAAGDRHRWFEAVASWRGSDGASCLPARAASGVPLLRGKAVAASLYEVIPATLREKIEKPHRDNLTARLPSSQPVAVGRTAVFRTATRWTAIDLTSGDLLWQSPAEDGLRWFLEGRKLTDKTLRTAKLARAAKGRLFDDAKAGAIACDGRRVFGIEGESPDLPAAPRIVLAGDGGIALDAGGGSGFNYLNAYDIHSGKLVWSLGGPPKATLADTVQLFGEWMTQPDRVPLGHLGPLANGAADGAELANAVFLGPPVCWHGRLLAVVADKNEISLAEIDAQRGAVLAMLPITAAKSNSDQYASTTGFDDAPVAIAGGQAQCCVCQRGVAVCGVGQGRFAAVDLVARRLLWACTFPEEAPAARASMWRVDDLDPAQEVDSPGWLDAAVMIASDRAVFMPRGADRLDALNLATGAMEWTAAREDGVYCASPSPDILLVVGRGSVRALRPSDGKPLWAGKRIDFPGQGVVCGRGFLSEAGYCIPLSSGEILVVDAARGRIVGRSRAIDGDAPGNLLACGDCVLSCGAYGAKVFPACDKEQTPELAPAMAGADPQRMLLQAERLLALGRPTEAAKALQAYLAEKPSDAGKRMLADALLDALAADEPGAAQLAAECASLLSASDQWPRVAWETAAGDERRGRRAEAFAAYLRCLDGVKKPDEAVRIDALRTQSVLCRAAVRLEDLYRTADAGQRAAIDRQIAERRADLDARKFLARFGWHSSASQMRLDLAKKTAAARPSAFWAACASVLGNTPQEVKGRLEADVGLRRVLVEGSPPQQREAAALLAALLAAADRTDEAAWWYCRLRDEMGDAACLDGKTGKELFDALKADSPVRKAMERKPLWPSGKVRVTATHAAAYLQSQETLPIMAAAGRAEPCPQILIERNATRICARNAAGRDAWAASYSRPEGNTLFYYSWRSYDPQAVGWWVGNQLVVSVDGVVCALDGYGRTEAAWTHAIKAADSSATMYAAAQQRDPLARAPATQALRVAPSGRAVCFSGERGLTAVDALSGKVLWTREDLPAGCDLFGDDEILLATPPEAAEALVLRVCDGSELGRRRVGPIENRLAILGRKVLSFAPNAQRPELAMRDAWTGKTVWKRDFATGAKAWWIAADEAAVMEPEGRLSIVRLRDGADALTAQADPAEKLEGIYVFRASDRYILVANGAVAWAKGAALPTTGEDIAPVNGRLYGFDRAGKRLWACNVVNQAMQMGQNPELPILVFSTAGQRSEESKTIYYQKAHVLDTRTGETLYRRIAERYGMRCPGVECDLDAKTIKVGGDWGTVTLTFTDEPR